MTGHHRRPGPTLDTPRRRFLAGLVGLFGLGTIATLIRNRIAVTTSTSLSRSTSATTPGTTTASSQAATSGSEAGQGAATTSTTGAESAATSEVDATTQASTVDAATQPATTRPQPTVTSNVTAGAGLLLLEKAGWGAQPEGPGFVNHTVTKITVHHTAAVLGSNAKAPARIRQHQNYHQDQGWPDIAYHVMIDQAGNLYEGRPMNYRGDTFTSYDPDGHFLPCLEGDYNTETPTEIQLEALARLCAWAAGQWGVDPGVIGGHRDYAQTTCPGAQLYDDISEGSLGARVAEILTDGVPGLTYLRGAAATAAVAAIEAGG